MSKLISGKNPSSESQKSPAFPQCQSIALIAEQWWTPADHRREANGQWIWTVLLTVFWVRFFANFANDSKKQAKLRKPPLRLEKFVDILHLSNVEPLRTTCWNVRGFKLHGRQRTRPQRFFGTLLPRTTCPMVQTSTAPIC